MSDKLDNLKLAYRGQEHRVMAEILPELVSWAIKEIEELRTLCGAARSLSGFSELTKGIARRSIEPHPGDD